jgi:DNA mismatch repair protein MutL
LPERWLVLLLYSTDKTSAVGEMQAIVDELFACQSPNYSPEGKLAITILAMEEIDKKFR